MEAPTSASESLDRLPTSSRRVYAKRELLACARRELEMRKRVYPAFVNAKRMAPFKAEDEIDLQKAIVEHFEELIRGDTSAA